MVVKDRYYLDFLNGPFHLVTIDILSIKVNGPSNAKQSHLHLIMRREGPSFKEAEGIKISKVSNKPSLGGQKDFSFVNNVKILVNYIKTFELEFSVRFMEAKVQNVFDDIILFWCLP